MRLPKLLTVEIPEISERWRWIMLPFMVCFASGYALTVTVDAMFHHSIMVGPGFMDDGNNARALATNALLAIEQQYPTQARLFFWLFLPLLAFVIIQNAIVTLRSYTHFERATGTSYSLREFVLMFSLNGLQVLLLIIMLAAIGIGVQFFGGHFSSGWQLVYHMTQWSQNALQHIPTLIVLPWPLPLLLSLLLVDLIYYWLHRITHSYRLPWLLLHRSHHITENLMMPTTQPVFVAAPLFLLVAIPLQLLIGISTQLFNPEPMIVEALTLRLFNHSLGIYSHCAAYYAQMQHNRWLRRMSAFFGVGNYHYVHHSAQREHGLINLGNFGWMAWDRLFGTFVEPPDTPPPTGLTNNPPLYQNPLRLALAGMLQISYELAHNSPRLWWRILLADSWYTPPASYDFATKKDS